MRRPRYRPASVLVAMLVAVLVVISVLTTAGPAWAQPTPPAPPSPDTSDCPYRRTPAPAPGVDGRSDGRIPPLPVPDDPIGGDALGSCDLVLPDGAPAPPRGITAASWIVAEVGTGRVLAAKDPHGRHRPASIIKLLIALLTVERLDPKRVVTTTRQDAAVPGSSAGIVADGRYTVRQLLGGLLLQSGNGIAHALAREMGGQRATVRAMTRRARGLGGDDTRVATPSGLEGPGMSTSAYDMALITSAVLREPLLARLLRTKRVRFPGGGDRPSSVLRNDNRLLGGYRGAVGGKTGYTGAAQHTYVGIAERGGRFLLTVLMRAQKRPLATWQQGALLLDYGFALPPDAAVGELVDPGRENPGLEPNARAALPEGPDSMASTGGSGDSTSGGQTGSGSGNAALVGWVLVGAAAAVGLLGLLGRRRASGDRLS